MPDGFAAFKAGVETTYSCLGITCAEVGAFQNAAGVYTGMDACSDASTSGDGYESWTSDTTVPPATTVAATTVAATTDAPTTVAAAAAAATPATTSAPTEVVTPDSLAASFALGALLFS